MQIQKALDIPFFRQNIIELTEGFAAVGDTVSRNFGRRLCWLRADQSRQSL
jgi:hypothetical protein